MTERFSLSYNCKFSISFKELFGTTFFGSKGYIEVTNINNPEVIKVYDKEYKEIASYLPPQQITGYEYEVEACIRALENGALECPEMPHAETIRVMEMLDGIRKSWNYEIPLIG